MAEAIVQPRIWSTGKDNSLANALSISSEPRPQTAAPASALRIARPGHAHPQSRMMAKDSAA